MKEKKRAMTREELLEENEKLKIELANTKLELNNLKRVMFGTKREYTPETKSEPIEEQCSLFDNEEEIEKNVEEQIEEKVEEIKDDVKGEVKDLKQSLTGNAVQEEEHEEGIAFRLKRYLLPIATFLAGSIIFGVIFYFCRHGFPEARRRFSGCCPWFCQVHRLPT